MTTTTSLPIIGTLRVPRPRIASLRAVWLEASSFTLFAVVYAVYAIRAQVTGQTHAFDLGIFTQGVRGYAEGIGPISAIKGPGFSLLGDHFSPVTALLAPFYAVFPTPITLLIAQALLVAASSIPVTRLFKEWFGTQPAVLAALSYGLSFGVINAIGFDFHEVALAVPVLSLAMVSLARRRVAATITFSAPLVLVKEDMGFTVAALGIVLALVTRRWIAGAALTVFGLGATLLEVKVLIPAFNPDHHYAYSGQLAGAQAVAQATLANVDVKAITVLCLIALTGLVGLRSPLLLVAVPTLLWRFASSNPNYWGMSFHYGLLLMPVAFVALADGLRRMQRSGVVGADGARWFVGASLVVSLVLLPATPFLTFVKLSAWRPDAQAVAVQQVASMIPSGSTVAATGLVIPQIVNRTDAWVVWDATALQRNPQWIVVDTVSPSEFMPVEQKDRDAVLAKAVAGGWKRVFDRDGVIAFKR